MTRNVVWTVMSVVGSAVAIAALVSGNSALFVFGLVVAWAGTLLQWGER